MPESIKLNALDLSGETLTLFLRKSDGTLLNTGGDPMTESGTTGFFTATLTESRVGLGSLAVRVCAGVESAANVLYDGFLPEGSLVIDSLTGGGDATLAKQTEILTAIADISLTQLAAITVESGVIANFPETLTIGDSYTSSTGRIKIAVTDSNGDPITQLGSLDFADADISFTAFRSGDSAQVTGTCQFVDGGAETYVWLTLLSSQTILGKAEYTYEGRLKFFWEGPSSGTTDDEQKTYKTTPFKFVSNP